MILLVLFVEISIVLCQADGWRMVDRFYGFRYEIVGNVIDTGLEKVIQAKADELACFGWVQKSKYKNALVGEVRCPKARGPIFADWLTSPNDIKLDEKNILIYEDTKIRLHFSHFKIIEGIINIYYTINHININNLLDTRDTCFLDKPHQCPDLSQDNNNSNSNDKQTKDEL